jgi:hypothetical protein
MAPNSELSPRICKNSIAKLTEAEEEKSIPVKG